MNLRARLARRLRHAADRIDPSTGPRVMTAVSGFTLEEGLGVVFRDDGHGCPLWYMAEDYDRAHDEAGNLDAAHAWLPGHRLTEPGQWRRPRVITDDVELPDATSPHRPAGDPVCDNTLDLPCPDHGWGQHRCILVPGHQQDPKSVKTHGCPCGATWTWQASHA